MPKAPWSTQNYVGIKLFAGAPNPRWPMSPGFFQQMRSQLLSLPVRPPDSSYLVPNSWYGGVVVHLARDADATAGRRRFLINNEHVFDSASEIVRFDRGRIIEEQLFSSMPLPLNELIDKLTFRNAIVEMNERKRIVGARSGEDKPACEGAPTFAPPPPPSQWDSFPGIEDNNCYNYANNVFSPIDDAQPGRQAWSGAVTEREMHDLLVADGLVPVGADRKSLPNHCSTETGAHLIAVCLRRESGTKVEQGAVVRAYKDYHCFRLDRNPPGARWSHKDGNNPTTANDNRETGFPLNDLGTAIFRVEHLLVGYYWSVPGRRNIGMPVM